MMELGRLSTVLVLFVLALGLAGGVTSNIVACIVWDNWWPLFVLGAFLLASLPNVFMGWCSEWETDFMDDRSRSWQDVAYFLTGVFLASGFGIPFIMKHALVIELWPALLSLAGGLLIYGSIELYLRYFHTQKEDEF